MRSRKQTVIERFDNLFNDEFIEKATEREIELSFDRLVNNCRQDNMNDNEVIGELEFYCNSFIANIARA
ncbi:MAG: hypothetical protein JXR78_05475 [Victivallales bacterium]|nr:hypothetical protein [Victivallales bacterium]